MRVRSRAFADVLVASARLAFIGEQAHIRFRYCHFFDKDFPWWLCASVLCPCSRAAADASQPAGVN